MKFVAFFIHCGASNFITKANVCNAYYKTNVCFFRCTKKWTKTKNKNKLWKDVTIDSVTL